MAKVMAKTVKLADIAAIVNVSTVTVSKALSDQKGVSEEMRARIKQLAKEMGYQTPTAARLSSNKRTYNIGVLISEIYFDQTQSFYWQMYQSVATKAVSKECFTLLEVLSMQNEKEMILPKILQEEKIDGLIIIGMLSSDYLSLIERNIKVPYICLDFYDRKHEFDAVITDNFYGMYKLVIPNKEVREVFVLQIQEWFKAVVAKDDDTMKLLSRAILDKDEKQIARQLNIVMSRMISILDTKASDDMKENFYHGLLLGLLRGSNPGWLIKSNRESGDGFSDILIKPEDPDAGIVIEVKYAKEMKNLDAACEAAMTQIKEKRYDEALRDEGRCDILAYGIAFCRKRCRVVGEKIND